MLGKVLWVKLCFCWFLVWYGWKHQEQWKKKNPWGGSFFLVADGIVELVQCLISIRTKKDVSWHDHNYTEFSW